MTLSELLQREQRGGGKPNRTGQKAAMATARSPISPGGSNTSDGSPPAVARSLSASLIEVRSYTSTPARTHLDP
jgi:hypothetical protein